jgi:indole-3-glycerol phosphate synthase
MMNILNAVTDLQRVIREETPKFMVKGTFEPDTYQLLEAASRSADALLILAMLLESKKK